MADPLATTHLPSHLIDLGLWIADHLAERLSFLQVLINTNRAQQIVQQQETLLRVQA